MDNLYEQTSDIRIGAFILAAGKSERFGAPKVLQFFKGSLFLTRIGKNLQAVGIERPVLVLGYQAQNILPRISRADAFNVVVNRDFEKGMFTSVQAAIKALAKSVDGALLCLIDQPHIRLGTYRRLMQSALARPETIIIPTFQQRGGHPVYLPASLFASIIRANAHTTLKDILNRHRTLQWRVAVDDSGILEDIDLPEDLIRLEKMF